MHTYAYTHYAIIGQSEDAKSGCGGVVDSGVCVFVLGWCRSVCRVISSLFGRVVCCMLGRIHVRMRILTRTHLLHTYAHSDTQGRSHILCQYSICVGGLKVGKGGLSPSARLQSAAKRKSSETTWNWRTGREGPCRLLSAPSLAPSSFFQREKN